MSDDLHVDGFGLQQNNSIKPQTPSCVRPLTRWMDPHPHLQLAAAQLFAHFQSCVHRPLQVPLQTSAEVPKHGGAAREHDVLRRGKEGHADANRQTPMVARAAAAALTYLVQRAPDINGAVLDHFIHHLRDGLREVWVGELDETKRIH